MSAPEVKEPTNAQYYIHEFKNAQLLKQTQIENLLQDFETLPGIIPFPTGVAAGQSKNFAITVNATDSTKIDIGKIVGSETGGIAISASGKRLIIDENVPWQTTTFTPPSSSYATTDPYGGSLYQITGNMLVPVNASTINYVWIEYLEVVNPDPATTVQDENDPPVIWYTYFNAGYTILVTTVAGQPAGHPDAIYLGTVTTVGTTITNIDSTGVTYCQRRGITVTGNTGDDSTVPSVYGDDDDISFQDHVRARGSGVITNRNPHGITAVDLGISPDVSVSGHIQYFHVTGLTNVADPVGDTTYALYPSISTPVATHILVQPLSASQYLTVNSTSYTRNNPISQTTATGIISAFFYTPYDSGDFTGLGAATYYFFINTAVPTAPILSFSTNAAVLTVATNYILCAAVWNGAAFTSIVDYRVFRNTPPLDAWHTVSRQNILGYTGFNLDSNALEYYNGSNWIAIGKEFFSTEMTGTGSQQSIPHGLNTTPDIVLITMRSSGTAWESAAADATAVYVTSSAVSVKYKVFAKKKIV